MPNISPADLIRCQDVQSCFQSLYNFFFVIFLALAFLNFVYGAFQYLIAPTSIFAQDAGKRKMRNSIIAIIVVLLIPPLLQLINPGIFQGIKLSIPRVEVEIPKPYDPNFPGTFPGGGTPFSSEIPSFDPYKTRYGCSLPENVSYCSPIKIKEIARAAGYNIDDDLSKKLALICLYESGDNPSLNSWIDKCKDGYSFSIGLFQINMAVRNFQTPNGSYCYKDAIFDFDDQNNVYSCRVKNINEYSRCVQALQDPNFNTQIALSLVNSYAGLNHWSVWTGGVKNCF